MRHFAPYTFPHLAPFRAKKLERNGAARKTAREIENYYFICMNFMHEKFEIHKFHVIHNKSICSTQPIHIIYYKFT